MRRTASALIVLLTASVLSAESQQYVISTLAGGGALPTPVAALKASIDHAYGLAVDEAGNTYMSALNCIFKISAGEMIRIAGTGRLGFAGDAGPAINAKFEGVTGLARDGEGNLLLVDQGNHRIRKIGRDGTIITIAGNGSSTYSGDGGPAVQAGLVLPTAIALDGSGNLYIMDSVRVRRVDGNGMITTVAGNGARGFSGDGGAAVQAQIGPAIAIAVEDSGNIYISQGMVIRKVDTKGIITRIAGSLTTGDSGDGGPASAATFSAVYAMAVDSKGNLYLFDEYTRRIRKLSADGIIRAFAGNGARGFSGDGGPATVASLGNGFVSVALAVDSTGVVTFDDYGNSRVRRVTADGIIHTIAGNGTERFSGDGGPAADAQLSFPEAVAADSSGAVYFTDSGNGRVRKISTAGIITTIAGTGSFGFSGDGGPATAAEIGTPTGIAVDAAGNLYVACIGSDSRIRKISAAGIISTVAGGGALANDGVAATAARLAFSDPAGIAVDPAGNIYFTDVLLGVRKISAGGTITTVKPSGSPGILPRFTPTGIAADAVGNLYVADTENSLIYKIYSGGAVAKIAGTPNVTGASGDGGLAVNASVFRPSGVAIDSSGNLYIADTFARKIRRISTDGIITTIAGAGTNSDDGIPSVPARLSMPMAVAVDERGSVYFADDNVIRRLDPTAPRYVLQAVTNGASGKQGPIAPGEIIVLWGSGLGPQDIEQAQTNGDTLYTLRSGTVHVNGLPAPIIYAQDNQVAAVVPYAVRGNDTARITITFAGPTTAQFVLPIAPATPALFTLDSSGAGAAAALNQNNSVNSPAAPVRAGDVIILFGTGEGDTNPPATDGRVATEPLPQPVLPVVVTIGGKPAAVQYAGSAPRTAGLLQVNAVVPAGLASGANEVILQVGNYRSPSGVTIAVQ